MADEPREVLPASAQANKFPGLVESDVPTIEPGAITFAVIPDSQSAVGPYPDIYEAQMEGIDELCGPLNIAGVFHVGDITNDNTKREWECARAGMNQLLSKVPCLVVPGNHDMPGHGKIRDTERFNSHFPLAELRQQASFGDTFGDGRSDNTYHRFTAGGIKWLVIGLEFGPRNAVLTWANGVIAAHPDHKVIVVTHAYLYHDSTHHGCDTKHDWVPSSYGIADNEPANSGFDIWHKLARRHPNILLVFGGHVLRSGVGQLVSIGMHGNRVYQMLANYQMRERGGEGFTRFITISPEKGIIRVRTYSPFLRKQMRDPAHSFVFTDVVL